MKLSQLVPNYYFARLSFKGSFDLLREKKNTTVAFSFKYHKIAVIVPSINIYINLDTSLSLYRDGKGRAATPFFG